MAVGKITSRAIETGAVTADQIATGAITDADISVGEITAAKLHTTLDFSTKTFTMHNNHVTETMVTQHESALSVTASQVTDLSTYLSNNDFDTATNIIATITDSAPTTLDTLNELAAALGDDPNFATTTANSIAEKLPLAGGTLTGNLAMENTDAGSAAGPEFTLFRNSASAANADYLGQIKFDGKNDAAQTIVYAKISGKIADATDGSEDGIIEVMHKKAGSNNISARFKSDKLQLINGTELEVDGNVSIGANSAVDSSGFGKALDVNGTDGAALYLRDNTDSKMGVIGQWNEELSIHSKQSDGTIAFYVDSSDKMKLLSNGDLGIGVTASATRLDVATDVANNFAARFVNSSSSDSFGISVSAGSSSSNYTANFANRVGTSLLRIRGDGNIGIGVSDPTEKLTMTVGDGGGILQSTYYNGTVTSGQKMGVIGFKGYSQGNTVAGADAKIEAVAASNHSGSSAPSHLDFYTKDDSIGPGSGATRRFRIDEYGAAMIHSSKNNWSRLEQTGNTNIHYRLYGAGSSTATYNLLRYRRHYWGSGSVHITLFQTYYSSTSQGEYWLSGHGRSDGSYSPSYGIQYQDIYNGPGSGRLSINMPGGAPGNSAAEIVDLSISIPAYVYYLVKIQVSHSTWYPTTTVMGSNNSYALHA